MDFGQFQAVVVLLAVVLAFLVSAAIAVFILLTGRSWLQAYLSGVPLSFVTLVGMRLRKTNVNAVVRTLVMATQSGVDVSWRRVESAYLAGIDLEKIILAMVEAQKQGIAVTFQELIDAEQRDRLHEKLKGWSSRFD